MLESTYYVFFKGAGIMSETVLEIRDLSKKVKDKKIVSDLTINISAGEIVGFVGPNGAGKTTTMRMIVNLVSPTKGEIKIKGHNVQKQFTTAMKYVGGVIENPQLYGYLTGYHNLLHYARMVTGVTKERIDEVVSIVGLASRIGEKVHRYSLGMRQRLGLAQALLQSPSLLILDEPTNGLDPNGIREIYTYLRKIADEQGVSIFVSSHILSEMEQLCDRILFIQNGEIVDEYQGDRSDGVDKISVEFIVEPIEKAMQFLQTTHPECKVMKRDGCIVIDLNPGEVAKINKQLIEQGVAVSGVQKVSKGLEDKYAEVTGGKTEC